MQAVAAEKNCQIYGDPVPPPPTLPPTPLPAIQTLFQVIFLRHTHKQTERIHQGICKI